MTAPRQRSRSQGPGGARLQTPSTPDRFEPFRHHGYALAVTSSKTTWFVLTAPRTGRWTVSSAAGSAAIVRIQRADPLRSPNVHAIVTGSAAPRTLTWRVAPQHGVTVRFVEADGTEPTIASSGTRGHGRTRFAVPAARPGLRRIVAVVIVDGLPRSQRTVATFRVRPTPLPRVTHARYRLRGRVLTATWRRAPGAARYELDVRLTTGLMRWFVNGRSSQTSVTLPGGHVRRVTVTATDAIGRSGPPVRVDKVRRSSTR